MERTVGSCGCLSRRRSGGGSASRTLGHARQASLALDAARIRSGTPAHPHEFSDAVTPLDSGGMDGITDGKGCYPGQEVIERTLALGKPSRTLKCFTARDEVSRDEDVFTGERKVGRVTSVLKFPNGPYMGLALIKSASAEALTWTTNNGITLQASERSGQL